MPSYLLSGELTGSVEASVVFSSLDRNILKPLLPEHVEMVPQDFVPQGQHPVYWTFNLHQNHVSTPIPGLYLNYNEFALVITCVRYRDQTQLLGFPVVLYLNSWLATIGGRLFWHFNKRYAACVVHSGGTDSSFRVKNKITGVFHNEGPAIPAAQSENFQTLKPLLDQPLLTVGWFNYYQSAFLLDFTGAQLQPQAGEIALQQFLPGLSSETLPFQSLQKNLMGAFFCNVPWTLKSPKRL